MGFFVAMEDFKLVGNFEFFEEPEYTLGTGFFQPMGRQLAFWSLKGVGLLVPVELDFCFFGRRNRIRCHRESNDK
jgi:hypothetical protein